MSRHCAHPTESQDASYPIQTDRQNFRSVNILFPFPIPTSQRTSSTQNNYLIFAQTQLLNKLNTESISTIQIILFFLILCFEWQHTSIIGVINIGY